MYTGVGKTSLTHLICHQQPISNPSWTIGCSVEVKLHEYKEGTPNQRRYFIELWDIGGSQNHKNTRSVFYNPTNGTDKGKKKFRVKTSYSLNVYQIFYIL